MVDRRFLVNLLHAYRIAGGPVAAFAPGVTWVWDKSLAAEYEAAIEAGFLENDGRWVGFTEAGWKQAAEWETLGA